MALPSPHDTLATLVGGVSPGFLHLQMLPLGATLKMSHVILQMVIFFSPFPKAIEIFKNSMKLWIHIIHNVIEKSYIVGQLFSNFHYCVRKTNNFAPKY